MKMCSVNNFEGDYLLYIDVSEGRKALGTRRNPQREQQNKCIETGKMFSIIFLLRCPMFSAECKMLPTLGILTKQLCTRRNKKFVLQKEKERGEKRENMKVKTV